MAKFIYRMQNILDIKLKLEQTAKQEYSEARVRLSEEEEKLALLQTRKADYYHAYQESIQGKLDFRAIEENANAMDIMDLYISDQSEMVKKRSKELELARQKMEREIRERKMHEKLKEKKFQEFLKELNAQEKRETDEVAGYLFMSAASEQS